MSELVSRASYAAFKHLRERGIQIARSHLGEIHAALLGYSTYSALVLEEADPTVTTHLRDARVLTLDQRSGLERAGKLLRMLKPEQLQDVIDTCSLAIAECAAPAAVFESVDDLFDDWAKGEIASLVLDAQDLAPSVRVVLGEPTVEGSWSASGSLWHSRIDWVIEAHGTVREVDEDGDVVDGGVSLAWRGRMVFGKAGRAGLIFDTGGATCQHLNPLPGWFEALDATPRD